MKLRALSCFSAVAVAAACGGTATPPNNSPYIDGFDPPELKQGLTRYITPTIEHIKPGQEGMWCQWLSDAVTEDTDILDTGGYQSIGGHHVVLYATSIKSPIGTSRECTDSDQVALRYLGAVGGEGVSGFGSLPAGVVYRLPKGWSLMANVHYYNVGTKEISGQSVVDIKTGPANPSAKVASLFTNLSIDFALEAKKSASLEVTCDIKEELPLIGAFNHMHQLGTAVKSEVIHQDGTIDVLVDDKIWEAEATFNPQFRRWDQASPYVLKVGDKIRTKCTWNNTSDGEVSFPREMCVTGGFYLGTGIEVNCISNSWEHG